MSKYEIKKSITQNDLKNKGDKNINLREIKSLIWYVLCMVRNVFFYKKQKLECTYYFDMFVLYNIHYKCKLKSLSKHLIIIYVKK